MTTATWIVQSNKIPNRQTLPLIQALSELGEPWRDIGIGNRRVLNHDDIANAEFLKDKNLIPYGSCELTTIAAKREWKHVFFSEETFRGDVWQKNHPLLLNQDARTMTLAQAKEFVEDNDDKWFIRPVEDLKKFAGEVITGKDLKAWVDRLVEKKCELSIDTEIWIASPKDIQMEWRYFVVGGKIVTGSSYRYLGQPHRKEELDADVLAEAQEMANIWLPHETVCMDLALSNDKLYVIEFNGLNAAGFYKHNVKAFAKAVSDYARQR